jgi:hypothetical protein
MVTDNGTFQGLYRIRFTVNGELREVFESRRTSLAEKYNQIKNRPGVDPASMTVEQWYNAGEDIKTYNPETKTFVVVGEAESTGYQFSQNALDAIFRRTERASTPVEKPKAPNYDASDALSNLSNIARALGTKANQGKHTDAMVEQFVSAALDCIHKLGLSADAAREAVVAKWPELGQRQRQRQEA